MSTKLTDKQSAFIEAYLTSWNATQAAITAKYSKKTARVIGPENLSKPAIQGAIQVRLAALKMSADEVLVRLAEHARGTADDFLAIERVTRHDMVVEAAPTEEEPKAVKIVPGPGYEVVEVRLDLEKAKDRGKLHLLKEYKVDKGGAISVKWHDSQAALALLAKIHGLLVDRTELTGKDGAPIAVVSSEDLAAARTKALAWEEAQDG